MTANKSDMNNFRIIDDTKLQILVLLRVFYQKYYKSLTRKSPFTPLGDD